MRKWSKTSSRVMTSFSARLYGRRGSKKMKKTLIELEKEGQDVKEKE
jgi:predicted site-specific integrase-resolvase